MPRAQEGFVPTLESHAVAACHDQPLGHCGAVARVNGAALLAVLTFRQGRVGIRPAAIHIAGGKADDQVRSAMVGFDGVRIKRLRRRIDVAQVGLHVPMEKVLRRGRADGAIADWIPRGSVVVALGIVPPVGAILAAHAIPEGGVLRVERAVDDHRPVAHRRPVEAVRRLERDHAPGSQALEHRLVARVRGGRRILVPADGRGARVDMQRPGLVVGHDDVVGFRALELMQSQLGFAPVDAIRAFRGAAKRRRRLDAMSGRVEGDVPRLVKHAVAAAVLEDAVKTTAVALPRGVMHEHDLAWLWMMKTQFGLAREPLDQESSTNNSRRDSMSSGAPATHA